jgi:hypothetical protein
MKGFISRMTARHANPQNNIVPRLPGKFEGAGSLFNNLSDNEVAGSGNAITRQKNVYKNVSAANENNDKDITDENKASATKTNNQAAHIFTMPLAGSETSEQDSFIIQNEDATPIAARENNDDKHANDFRSSVNIEYGERSPAGEKSALVSSSSLTFITSGIKQKKENIQEPIPSPDIKPLFTTSSKQHPDVPAYFISGEANQQSVIKVHIGRIEIKAVNQQPPNEENTKSTSVRKPKMSLDDYLKKRNAR